MTIFQVLTNKLMSGYSLYHFRILYAALLKVKDNDNQKLLDQLPVKLHEHEFRIQLLDLFTRYQTERIEFLKILLKDQELFLWNHHHIVKVKLFNDYVYQVDLYNTK